MPKKLVKKVTDLKEAKAEAMSWLGKMHCMEAALQSGELSRDTREKLEYRLHWLRRGLGVLGEEERKILLGIADGCSAEDLCELCAREKSSVYAIRKRAMDKFALALFGRLR